MRRRVGVALLVLTLCAVVSACASRATRLPKCSGRAVPINAPTGVKAEVRHAS
jgi:hypothetical protein